MTPRTRSLAPRFPDSRVTLSVAALMHSRPNPHRHRRVINPLPTPWSKPKTTAFFFPSFTTEPPHRPRHPLTSALPKFNAHSDR
jgi:hypothetical protein